MNIITKSSEIIYFEYFLLSISFVLMPSLKKISDIYISDNSLNRKINQYTHWNLVLLFINYILNNCFNYNNELISKFIAYNSLNIMILFHLLLLYDLRFLFKFDGQKSFIKYILPNNNIPELRLLQLEYIFGNIVVHILPVYYYKDSLLNYYYIYNNVTLSVYILLYKSAWLLNIVGNFHPSKLYNPDLGYIDINIIKILSISTIILDKSLLYLTM